MFSQQIIFLSLVLAGSMFIVGFSMAEVDPDTIVGLWPFDEEQGDTTEDISENGYEGELGDSEWVDGKFGAALEFNPNVGSTVTAPLGEGSVTDNLTALMWIKFIDTAGQNNYFSIWDSSSKRYVPYMNNGFKFWSNNWNVFSGFAVSADEWYHVANVYDGKKVYVYVDGNLEVSQDVAAFTLEENQQTAYIGNDVPSNCCHGSAVIDEVAIFNVALTGEQIADIMEQAIALSVFAVAPSGKLATTWGQLKNSK